MPSIFDYALQSITKRPRLSSENRRDRRMHQEDSFIFCFDYCLLREDFRYFTISDSL